MLDSFEIYSYQSVTLFPFPSSKVDKNHPLQMLIANVDYDDFKGKMGIGRVLNGELNAGDSIAYGKPGEPIKNAKIAELYVFNNVGREKVETASAGTSLEAYCCQIYAIKHRNKTIQPSIYSYIL